MRYNHILTSVIGAHPNIQDAIKYFENEDRIVAVVADGLGSKKKSGDGARLICYLIVEELKSKQLPLLPADIASPNIWYKYFEDGRMNYNDYCTTCSFVVIDKKSKQMSVGQIGDSPIFVSTDSNPVVEIRREKDFSNITDCLGSVERSQFVIHNYVFTSIIRVLVTSDGIGDELNSSSLDSLFSYLSAKYQSYTPKSRSRRFTKEIKNTVGKLNHDDKSAIYIWSI